MSKVFKAITVPTGKEGYAKGDLLKRIGHDDANDIYGETIGEYESCITPETCTKELWQSQYLVITSDEEIKEGDWILSGNIHIYQLCKRVNGNLFLNGLGEDFSEDLRKLMRLKKILASNHPSIYNISQSDLEWWVESGCPSDVKLQDGYAYYNGKKIDTIFKLPEDDSVDIFIPTRKTIKKSELTYKPRIVDGCVVFDREKERGITIVGGKQNKDGFDFKGWSETITNMDISKTFRQVGNQQSAPIQEDDVEVPELSDYDKRNHPVRQTFQSGQEKIAFDSGHREGAKYGASYRTSHAKSDAVEFAEWILNEMYEPVFNGKWNNMKNSGRITSEQLYTLFSQSKEK